MQAPPHNVVMFVPAGQTPVYGAFLPPQAVLQPAGKPALANPSTAARAPKSVQLAREHYDLFDAAVKNAAFRKEINPRLEHRENCRGELLSGCMQAFGWVCQPGG